MKTSPDAPQAAPQTTAGAATAAVALRTAAQAEAMVVATVQGHADDLLRVARRYSLCSDDAHEAYQRALEIYIRHARRLEADTAHRWLFTVLKHEALAVRKQRSQLLGADESELDRLEARTTDSPEDRALAADDVTRAAAALRRLKPDEIRALWLKASGLSYAEIMKETGWSYTKVNRCLAEGRASLTRHVAAIESGADCEQYRPMLSRLLDGEASRKELRPLRAHLKACVACRSELRALHERGATLRVLLPSGVLAGSAASHAAADAPGLLTRLYETVATTIHDRAALSAIKLQAVVETTSTGKLAAVAASAAAVAGGGAAAATQLPDRNLPSARAVEQRAAGPKRVRPPASTSMGRLPTLDTLQAAMRPTELPEYPRSVRDAKRPKKAESGRKKATAPAGTPSNGSASAAQREFESIPAGPPAARAPSDSAPVSPLESAVASPARAADLEFAP